MPNSELDPVARFLAQGGRVTQCAADTNGAKASEATREYHRALRAENAPRRHSLTRTYAEWYDATHAEDAIANYGSTRELLDDLANPPRF